MSLQVTIGTYSAILEENKAFLVQQKLYGSALQALQALGVLQALECEILDEEDINIQGQIDLFESIINRIINHPTFKQLSDAKELAEELTTMIETLDHQAFTEEVAENFDGPVEEEQGEPDESEDPDESDDVETIEADEIERM